MTISVTCACGRTLKVKDETPQAFWARVHGAGRLAEALALYDQVAAEWAAWSRTPKETKARFPSDQASLIIQ